MPFQHIDQISAWLEGSGITLLELHGPAGSVRLVNDAASSRVAVTAPCVGVFLHRHPLSQAELAPPGAQVGAGQVVGLLQIGVLLVPVTAPRDGRVVARAAEHGAVVGFGAKLIELVPLTSQASA
jgi:acetyl-CoA carboxylase biotin carboxyl carrier protein